MPTKPSMLSARARLSMTADVRMRKRSGDIPEKWLPAGIGCDRIIGDTIMGRRRGGARRRPNDEEGKVSRRGAVARRFRNLSGHSAPPRLSGMNQGNKRGSRTTPCAVSAHSRLTARGGVGMKMKMIRSAFLLGFALAALTGCSSRPLQQPAPIRSRPTTSGIPVDARLQHIRDEYHLMGLSFTNNQVTVCTGLLSTERMKSLQEAIRQAVGPDVKVFTIIK